MAEDSTDDAKNNKVKPAPDGKYRLKKMQDQLYMQQLEEINTKMKNHSVRQTERLISNKFKNDRAHSVTFAAKINKLTKLTNNYQFIIERKDSLEGKITKIKEKRTELTTNIALINIHRNMEKRDVVKKMKSELDHAIKKEKESEHSRIMNLHMKFQRDKEQHRIK